MNIDKISVGDNHPFEFNVIIEIPKGGDPVKYELDKESGAMFVDRFLNTAMTYPGNYGFIPHTLAADGDPCDVLVLGPSPVVPGAVITVRPIGALKMTDEAGCDDKIIAVPINRLNPYYAETKNYTDLPQALLDQVSHFFQHYKDLERGKWVAGLTWVGKEEAFELVRTGIAALQKRSTRSRVVGKKATAAKKVMPKAAAPKVTAVKKAAQSKTGKTGPAKKAAPKSSKVKK